MSEAAAAGAPAPRAVGASGQGVWDLTLALVQDLPRGKLLDLAGGGGYLARQLADRGFDAAGSDLVDQWQFPELPFKQADLDARLPYDDAEFDVVTCIEGLGFVESPQGTLREFHRIVKPGGHVVISLPNIFSLQSRLRFLLNGTFRWFPHPPSEAARQAKAELFDIHREPIRPTALCFYLERAGFEVVRVEFGGKTAMALLMPLGWLLQGLVALHNAARKGKGKTTPAFVNSTPALLRGNYGVLARRR